MLKGVLDADGVLPNSFFDIEWQGPVVGPDGSKIGAAKGMFPLCFD